MNILEGNSRGGTALYPNTLGKFNYIRKSDATTTILVPVPLSGVHKRVWEWSEILSSEDALHKSASANANSKAFTSILAEEWVVPKLHN